LGVELSAADVRQAWTRASGLTRAESDRPSPAAVVATAAGIQAQDRRAARLSVWARGRHLDAAAIEDALARDRSVVRTWVMRGTLHLVPAEDVGWLLGLLGPVFVARHARRYRELGLDESTFAAATAAIGDAVSADGPLTRPELAERMRARGLDVEPGSQALAHLVGRAALEGVICCGPDHNGAETYVGLADWLGDVARDGPAGPVPSGDAALAELARRHLAAFGPARPEDLAAWSGLPVSRARAAWRLLGVELVEVVTAGRPAWALAGTDLHLGEPGSPVVRLLPAFDTYLLGHKDRALIVDDRFARRVWPGGGWIHPTVAVDGAVAGTWRLAGRSRARTVAVEPFVDLDGEVVAALDAEIERLRVFLEAA
jgi:hypothetical protein